MIKAIAGILAFIILSVVGYFADPKFHSQVDGWIGKNKVTQSSWDDNKQSAPKQVADTGTLSAILKSGQVRVSVQNPSKPFYFLENGRPKGFNVEFMNLMFNEPEFGGKRIALDTDHTVETYEDVPKQLLAADNRGKTKVDIAIDGLTFADEDLPGVVYTIPYVKDFGYSLITQKGADVNMSGKRIGILKGDPDVKAYVSRQYPDSTLVEVSDKADTNGKWIVGHFNNHTVDAVIYDYPFAVAEVEGTNLVFAVTKLKGSDIQYKIGVRKEDTDLVEALNSAIRKVVETDEYGALLRKYFMSAKVISAKSASGQETVYTVVKGDTLSTIAQAQLGNKMRFTDIQFRNNLANPNFISTGQKLVIPK